MSFKIQPWLLQDRRDFAQDSLLRGGASAPQEARLLPRVMQVLGLCNVNGSVQFQRGDMSSTVHGKVRNCTGNNNPFIAPQTLAEGPRGLASSWQRCFKNPLLPSDFHVIIFPTGCTITNLLQKETATKIISASNWKQLCCAQHWYRAHHCMTHRARCLSPV